MTSFLRPVAVIAWANSTSSHALIDVRSNVGRSPSTLRRCGMGGLFKPVLTLTVECTIGRVKARPAFATPTMLSIQSVRQAGFFEQPGEDHAADNRCLHVRLEDHRVAHCQRRSDRPSRQ